MKVMLISPCYPYRRARYELVPTTGLYGPPLGLGYIAAALELAGHDVRILDMLPRDLGPDDVLPAAAEFEPDVVGISCSMAFVHDTATAVAAAVKRALPSAAVVFGGNHATYDFRNILLAQPAVDFIVRFEGEVSLPALVDRLARGEDPAGLPDVAFRDSQGAVRAGPRRPAPDPGSLPWPARHLMNMMGYGPDSRGLMSASRGCPYRCAFCSSSPFSGSKVRARPAADVVDEMEHLAERYAVRHVMFIDDTFTISRPRVLRLCDEIQRRGLTLTWACDSRADLVNPPLLERMRAAGCASIFYGIESASDAVLRRMGKRFTTAQARQALIETRAAGIDAQASFIIGLPGETLESAQRIAGFVQETQPARALLNIFTVYPGTPVAENPEGFGVLSYSREWRRTEQASPMARTRDMTPDDVRRAYVGLVTALSGAPQPVWQ